MEVTTNTNRRVERTRSGQVVSVNVKHCLIDLGQWKESFSYDQIAKLMDDGTAVPVLEHPTKPQIDRAIVEIAKVNGVSWEDLVDREFPAFKDDLRLPDWVEPKTREEPQMMPRIDPLKLEEFVRRYNTGEKVSDIQNATRIRGQSYSEYFNHAINEGLIVKRGQGSRSPVDTTPDADKEPSPAAVAPIPEAVQPAVPGAVNLVELEDEAWSMAVLSDEELRQLDKALHDEAAARFLRR